MRSEWIIDLTETKLRYFLPVKLGCRDGMKIADDRKRNEIAWRKVTKIFGVLII